MTTEKRYLTIAQFCAYYPWPTYAGMRYRFRERNTNGYASAFLRDGKRIIIDVDRFWEILREKQPHQEKITSC
jgi:hypothetical protein